MQIKRLDACPLCSKLCIEEVDVVQPPDSEPRLEIWRCSDCNIMFLNPRFLGSELSYDRQSVDAYVKALVEIGMLFPDKRPNLDTIAVYYPEIRALAKRVWDDGSVLDIGCGIGLSTLALQSAGVPARGIDINANMVETGRELFGLDLHIEDLRNLTTRYRVATLNSVLEHVHEPVEFLEMIRTRVLSEDGFLVLTVPNILDISYVEHGAALGHMFNGAHVWYFTEETLAAVARRAGFEVIEFYKYQLEFSGVLGNAMRYVRSYLRKDVNLYGGIGCTLKAQ